MSADATASHAFDLDRCLADMLAIRQARKRVIREMGLTLDCIVAELSGSFVGTERRRELADMLAGLRDGLEEIA